MMTMQTAVPTDWTSFLWSTRMNRSRSQNGTTPLQGSTTKTCMWTVTGSQPIHYGRLKNATSSSMEPILIQKWSKAILVHSAKEPKCSMYLLALNLGLIQQQQMRSKITAAKSFAGVATLPSQKQHAVDLFSTTTTCFTFTQSPVRNSSTSHTGTQD